MGGILPEGFQRTLDSALASRLETSLAGELSKLRQEFLSPSEQQSRPSRCPISTSLEGR